jgi:hypothetical protein
MLRESLRGSAIVAITAGLLGGFLPAAGDAVNTGLPEIGGTYSANGKTGTWQARPTYVCHAAAKKGYDTCEVRSVPGGQIEQAVFTYLREIFADPAMVARTFRATRAKAAGQRRSLTRQKTALKKRMTELRKGIGRLVRAASDKGDDDAIVIDIPMALRHRGGRKEIVLPPGVAPIAESAASGGHEQSARVRGQGSAGRIDSGLAFGRAGCEPQTAPADSPTSGPTAGGSSCEPSCLQTSAGDVES